MNQEIKQKRKNRWFAHAIYKNYVSPFIQGVIHNTIKSAEERINKKIDQTRGQLESKMRKSDSTAVAITDNDLIRGVRCLQGKCNWNDAELDELDRKFDALCEYLKVEFVDEKISDGSEWGDKESFYARKKITTKQ
jgi:hypothetical protein